MIKKKSLWAACLSVLVLQCLALGQDKPRYVTDVKPFPGQPIQVLSKSVGDKKLSPSGEILAGSTWIQDFTLEIKNISQQTIVGANISFEIEATGNMKFPLLLPLFYNRHNKSSVRSESLLRPGEVTTIRVQYYDNVLVALRSSGVKPDDVTSAKLSVRTVDFDDDTRWYLGVKNRRDPNDPEKWILSVGQMELPLR